VVAVTVLLASSLFLLAAGLIVIALTGGTRYDGGSLAFFLVGVAASAVGGLGFVLWLLVHLMLKV
jgi:NADH:ubiquinone oxidoreductase subunit K